MRQGRTLQTSSRKAVINALVRLGGSISDPQGLVTRKLMVEAGLESTYSSTAAFSSLLKAMEQDGMIVRDVSTPKRCYEIVLGDLPEGWPVEASPVVSETPEGPNTAPEPPSATEVNGEATETTPEAVADAILARVAEILSRPSVDEVAKFLKAERDEMAARLSATLDENVRLRQAAREAQDTLTARSTEIRGLHERLRLAEENLKSVMRSGNTAISHEVRRQIAEFMREPPRA